MSIDRVLSEMLDKSDGSRLGEHSILPTKKVEMFSPESRERLRSQWDSAGRDAARIYLKLTEQDGSSIYLTGWDGESKFVGQSDTTGFGYIETKRLASAKLDESWDNQLTLGHIRRNLDEMDRNQVSDLVSRLKKCLTKRSKNRRQSEVKNFVKRFQKACAADKAKEQAKAKEVKSESKEPKHVLQGPPWVAPRDRALKSPLKDMQNQDDKKKDQKGKFSWHTKANHAVPMDETHTPTLRRSSNLRTLQKKSGA